MDDVCCQMRFYKNLDYHDHLAIVIQAARSCSRRKRSDRRILQKNAQEADFNSPVVEIATLQRQAVACRLVHAPLLRGCDAELGAIAAGEVRLGAEAHRLGDSDYR
jgi:hypothetical protein